MVNPESRLRRVTAEAVLNEVLKEIKVPSGIAATGEKGRE